MQPNKDTVQPCFKEAFSSVVWNIRIHRSGVLAVESRSPELKQVMFSTFCFLTNETYFKERSFEEPWNLNLAYVGEKTVILNSYEHPERPENKGVMSLDVKDGVILWQKFNISLNQVNDNGLEVYDSRIQPRKFYWIDHISGKSIDVQGADPEAIILFPESDTSFVMPAFVTHGDLMGEVLVLRYAGKLFLSFHEAEGGFLTQRLLVYQDDKVLIDDILIRGIQKLQPEAFFIQQNHLFYIRDKVEIIAYLV